MMGAYKSLARGHIRQDLPITHLLIYGTRRADELRIEQPYYFCFRRLNIRSGNYCILVARPSDWTHNLQPFLARRCPRLPWENCPERATVMAAIKFN
jgi:hypothetical protein